MTIIAIIKRHKLDLSDIAQYIYPLLYKKLLDSDRKNIKGRFNDYIWGKIYEHTEFIDIDTNDDLMSSIAINIHKSLPEFDVHNDITINTEYTFSTPKKIYQFSYGVINKKISSDRDKYMNDYGSMIHLEHSVVESSIVLMGFKYDLDANNDKKIMMVDVDQKDIIKLFRRRYYHSAQLITPDFTLQKYYYQDPQMLVSDIYGGLTPKHYSIFNNKYNLEIYGISDVTLPFNQVATRIHGSEYLYGNVLVLQSLDNNIYTMLSERELKRLNVLSYGKLKDRYSNDELINSDDSNVYVKGDNDKVVLWNKYIMVDKKIKLWNTIKNKCMNKSCENKIDINNFINDFEVCFRARACSYECLNIIKNDLKE
jgi:hypothetical protein